MENYTLRINGREHTCTADADTPLLWVLRDLLHLRGTKYGCGIGACGACTVLSGDGAIRSCSTPVSKAQNMEITTIEGLSENGNHPLQQAWIEHDVPQCGYCQAGQIMTAAALLKNNRRPSDEEISNALQGNLCRCGTYLRIRAAVKSAAQKI